jgi:sensor domain CHASE-containing protein
MERSVLIVVVVAGLLVDFVGGLYNLSLSRCLGGERAALSEFAHYVELSTVQAHGEMSDWRTSH